MVHAFPAVAFIRSRLPDATITWLVNDTYAEIVDLCGDVDDIILFRRRQWGRPSGWLPFLKFGRDLRRRKFDLVVDFQGLLRSGFVSFLTAAPRRVGFAHAREGASFFYNHKVLIPANVQHAVEKNLFLAASALDCDMPAGETPAANLRPSHDGEKQAEILFRIHRIDQERPIVAVAPAARWPSKRFPTEFFARVIDRVAEKCPQAQFWILGSRDEREVGAAVVDQCHACVPEMLMGEPNLVTLVEMLRRSDVLLTNDTGPMHLAAAAGTPVVALFGPTSPELTGPYGKGHVVMHGKCDTGPCFRRMCLRKTAMKCGAAAVSETETADAVAAKCKGNGNESSC